MHVYGPVPSRRLGQSLGIDPIPFKTCNWNCVYCQLGRSTPMTSERRRYIPPEAILAEVQAALAAHAPGTIDWVSFVGSGEPTLHSDLGAMIRAVKAMTSIPVAVITNGSLLALSEVRAELCAADAVLPTLCAADEQLFRQIHRPWPELTLARHLAGLAAFRAEYRGQLWIEVMLVHGLNDTEPALRALAGALVALRPDRVDLTLPVRPPAEAWAEPPDDEGLLRALAILGASAEVVHPAHGPIDLTGYADVAEAVLAVITRHPAREHDLVQAAGRWSPAEIRAALATLESTGRARQVERCGAHFWCAAVGRYAQQPT